ncbi:MAG: adenylosuccinate lyase [Enterobacteriaceae bacterium]
MKLCSLTAISPIDGRYNNIVKHLRLIFSEFALFKLRVKIEICWLKELIKNGIIKKSNLFDNRIFYYLDSIFKNFSIEDAKKIKNIEKLTNHDVKSVEYFVKKKISCIKRLSKVKEFVHFACTSEDINNISYAIILKEIRKSFILPNWKILINLINKISYEYSDLSMLSYTHGQPATPSTLGKEMANFSYRMYRQLFQLKKIKILGKMNGTVGNYNAHFVAYPNINWIKITKKFVKNFNINWNPFTTQVEPYDYIIEILNCIIRFNLILIKFCKDIWIYVSMGYLEQKYPYSQIGSSIMPHKKNPIFFENAEGNLGLSNSIMQYLSSNISISRLQRDLCNSTLLRNIGSSLSYSFIAYTAIINGIKCIKINKEKILEDLDKNWQILSEPIQTIMRKNLINNSYEKLKFFNKKNSISKKDIRNFISNLDISRKDKTLLKELTPKKYIGYSKKFIKFLKKIKNNVDTI